MPTTATDVPDQVEGGAERRTEVVEHLGGALAEAGLARLPARVFAALMATEDGRLTAAELAHGLEVSPAGISGAVRYLTNVRLIRRERERGSRRDVFVVLDDAWHDVLIQKDQIYAPIIAALVEHLGGLTAEQLEVEVYAGHVHSSTLRAELNRLRTLLGPDVLASRPYRLVVDTESGDAFTDEPDDLWRRVLRRQRDPLRWVAWFPSDPSLN